MKTNGLGALHRWLFLQAICTCDSDDMEAVPRIQVLKPWIDIGQDIGHMLHRQEVCARKPLKHCHCQRAAPCVDEGDIVSMMMMLTALHCITSSKLYGHWVLLCTTMPTMLYRRSALCIWKTAPAEAQHGMTAQLTSDFYSWYWTVWDEAREHWKFSWFWSYYQKQGIREREIVRSW